MGWVAGRPRPPGATEGPVQPRAGVAMRVLTSPFWVQRCGAVRLRRRGGDRQCAPALLSSDRLARSRTGGICPTQVPGPFGRRPLLGTTVFLDEPPGPPPASGPPPPHLHPNASSPGCNPRLQLGGSTGTALSWSPFAAPPPPRPSSTTAGRHGRPHTTGFSKKTKYGFLLSQMQI
ncbi:hypothetical protein HJG60_008947 [Phyllostomus discolor]|uniref:Uncharacterized protein n=1 Tax=Phyllostomus discolor TaxID=89673 RepID=A0A834DJ39_9CHIR|nr:hypothetical protein HJG60_008947 [Phyllostomus discolor]